MKTAPLCVALLAVLAAASARADQLQCNSKKNAERAVALLPPGSIMIDYCSLCTSDVKVVKIREARAVNACDYEVAVYGTVLARSEKTFDENYDRRSRYRWDQASYTQNIDLAYAYVEVSRNTFKWLGGVLGLRATVNTRTIRLPRDIYAKLGSHTMPQLDAKPPRAKPTGVRQLGFSLFNDRLLDEAIAAIDAGDLKTAEVAADKALDGLIAQSLGRMRARRLPGGAALRFIIADGLRDRLHRASLPLQGIHQGYALKALEELPLHRLERAMAVLAVWAAVMAHVDDNAHAIDQASSSLLLDPQTAADLHRRAPRAAALARFYAALYHLGVTGGSPNPADAKIVARRLQQYFEDEGRAFKGNYAQVLGRLAR
ncbi:MAG: hypothetical protein V3T05_00520 [Myxococcota bacterium]